MTNPLLQDWGHPVTRLLPSTQISDDISPPRGR